MLYLSFPRLKKKSQNEFNQENQNKDSVMKIEDEEQLNLVALHYAVVGLGTGACGDRPRSEKTFFIFSSRKGLKMN